MALVQHRRVFNKKDGDQSNAACDERIAWVAFLPSFLAMAGRNNA